MKKETIMIASGILIENYDEIKNIFVNHNLTEIKKMENGDWSAIVLGNENA